MRIIILTLSLMLLAGCSAKPGSEKWCAATAEKPKSDWTGDDAKTYARHCLLDSQTIGSKDWCENLDEKDKGDWTTSETVDYAKHCLL
jgi:hypothetical protein